MLNTFSVRCLLIPISGGQEQLLLPNTVIAEVCLGNEPERVTDNQPKWLLGIINWRNQWVPLLSIEEILSLPVTASGKKYRTIVLYGLESTQTMPFYALRSSDAPHILTVTEHSLINPNTDVHTGLLFRVEYDSKLIWLPDLTYLESLLKKSQMFLRPS